MTHTDPMATPDASYRAPVATLPSSLGYGAVAAVVVGLGSFFVAQFGAVLLIALPLAVVGWDEQRFSAWLASSNYATFVVSLAVSLLTLALIAVFLRRRKTSFAAIGLKRPAAKDFGYGLLGLLLYFVVTVLAITLVKSLVPGLDLEQEQELG